VKICWYVNQEKHFIQLGSFRFFFVVGKEVLFFCVCFVFKFSIFFKFSMTRTKKQFKLTFFFFCFVLKFVNLHGFD